MEVKKEFPLVEALVVGIIFLSLIFTIWNFFTGSLSNMPGSRSFGNIEVGDY